MKENEFAILHEFEGAQFLVNTDYDHDEEKHELTMKAWSEEANGFAEMKLSWSEDKEEDFKRTFDQLKDKRIAHQWYLKIINPF